MTRVASDARQLWRVPRGVSNKRVAQRPPLDASATSPGGRVPKSIVQEAGILPLYVQYVCERFQDARKTAIFADDIDRELRVMMDSREVQWFADAAQRIETYYAKLGVARQASLILKMLSHSKKHFVRESDIIEHLRSQTVVEHDGDILATLELLIEDNYLVRDSTRRERRYRFRYGIMRRWWKINRG